MPSFSDLPLNDLSTLLAYHVSRLGVAQVSQIEAYFGTLKAALSASKSEWQATKILTDNQCNILTGESLPGLVEEALTWGQDVNQNWLPIGSEDYPDLLQSIDDAPLLLSAKGNAKLLSDPQIAIVGSRHASKQGLNTAEDFAQHLSSQGLTIISGLALGIDTAAHEGGLKSIGKTIAVVATGLDRIYPAANQALGRQIVEEGVMISELPLGSKPLAYHFPKRNRIISGLSVGTLVVEAALKSGSLITARIAANQGREVFAVPGSIHNPQAKGCHQLIKQGAKLVESGQDILEELSALIQLVLKPQSDDLFLKKYSQNGKNLAVSVSSKVLIHIGYDPVGLDEIVVLSKSPASDIQAQLMLLELSGEVEALSGARWRRIK